MTFEEYKAIGGQENAEFFNASIVPADSMIRKVESEYSVTYYDAEKGRAYALRDMVDSMVFVNSNGAGNILSEKAGSYSVQRKVLDSRERNAIPYEIVSRFADMRRKPVGVIL